MNYILSIYTESAYQELYLPDINNADFPVVLRKNLFCIPEDIILRLDIIDNIWSIYESEQYDLYVEGRRFDKLEIRSGKKFTVSLVDSTIIPVTVDLIERGFIQSLKYDLLFDKITIGSSKVNDIINESSLVSGEHMQLVRTTQGWYVKDISKNGTFLNSKRVTGQASLSYGDYICAFGLKIIFLGTMIAINEDGKNIYVNSNSSGLSPISHTDYENSARYNVVRKGYYNRAPRIYGELYKDTIEIEAPPKPKQKSKRSFLSTIGPSFTMALPMILGFLLMVLSNRTSGTSSNAFMYTGLVTAGTSALLGIFWGSINYRNAIRSEKEEENLRYEKYRDYLMKTSESIKIKYQNNIGILLEKYPSADECSQYNEENPKLWSRNVNHDDFLFYRLGKGDMPFQADIIIPKEQFSLIDDTLADMPQYIYDKYCTMKGVPIGINLLKDKIIGVVGGKNKIGALELMKALTIQIAANNCYTDVKLAYMMNDIDEAFHCVSFFRWLPHTWSVDKKARYFANNKADISDVCYELTKIFRLRDEDSNSYTTSKAPVAKPYYVLFVEDLDLLDGEPLLKYIFSSKNEIGVTTVLFSERYEDLPNNCEKIIFNDGDHSGIYTPQTMSKLDNNIRFDLISTEAAERFTRTISGIEVAEIADAGEMPSTLTFLEMYDAKTVQDLRAIDHWKKNRTYETMKALIGYKSGGLPCYLDLHEKYHGPHGLVAGTTGSGKSEVLQTYILSLAINFSPEDVAFLIIDFKGGGMANLFAELPHLAGRVSNLSGNQIRRAMISIKSENIRRQKLFGEFGVNNINQYTRLVKSKDASIMIPHLFIIIDEFAELKRAQPEFLNELISIAQVGRSLGIHLILATQKPGGTVDGNIQSNSKFKLCLRVQDKQDSIEMIGKPDAAYIYNAGRCFLQVGNDEIFELFQSGWSGAIYDTDPLNAQNLVGLLTATGHIALVGKKGYLKHRESVKRDWLRSIIGCIQAAFEAYNLSFAINSDEIQINEIVQQAFEIMGQVGIDYSYSSKTAKKMKQLVTVMIDLNTADVDEIIQYTEKKGIQLPNLQETTQLDAVIKYLAEESERYGYERPAAIWVPVLPEQLFLKDINKKFEKEVYSSHWNDPDQQMWTLSVPIGLYDDPMNQAQLPVDIDLARSGHFAICGGVSSGKSTCLQTYILALISTYSPKLLNLYILDFSNNMLQVFGEAPHVGGVMSENDEDMVSKFFYMINQMLQHRKKEFRGGNYAQFIKSNGYKFPGIIIVIDNYANFKEKTNDKYSDLLFEISREGISCGIYLVISSGGFGFSEIPSKIADNIRNVIALNMGEKQKYLDVLRVNRLEILPEDVPGRGLVNIGGNVLEFQTALCLSAMDAYTRGEKIEKIISGVRRNYTGRCAKKVPMIPEKPIWNDIVHNDAFGEAIQSNDLLPFAFNKENAALHSINLRESFCYLICGKARTGRSNVLKILALSAAKKRAKICIVAPESQGLKHFSDSLEADYVQNAEDLYQYLISLQETIKVRGQIKHTMIEEGADDTEIFDRMSKEQMIVFLIADFSSFLEMVYNIPPNVGKISNFIEAFIEKGRFYNVYFLIDHNIDDSPALSRYKAYSLVTSYKSGIWLGGNIAAQRMFDFASLPLSFNEQTKPLKPGTGFTTETNEMPCSQVIIPYAKGAT